MPIRLPAKLARRYFILPADQPTHYLRASPRDEHGYVPEPWLKSRAELWNWLQAFDADPAPPGPPGVITFQQFCQHNSRPTSPFNVLAYRSRLGGYDLVLRHLWDARHIEEIQAALDQIKPFHWDDWSDWQISESHWTRWSHAEACYLFGHHLWTFTKADKVASAEELRLVFLEALDKDRTRFERLRHKFSGAAGARTSQRREPIPEPVRIHVWRRDGGQCVKCGSQERLEYDHIIPASKGGSSTERNIQLLCEACNRTKSDTI
jgi:hypothetical protein